MEIKKARTKAVENFDHVIKFLKNAIDELHNNDITLAIDKLEELKNKIEYSDHPFLTKDEIPYYCYPIRDCIITMKPTLTPQLVNYWNAHIDIIIEINRLKQNTVITSFDENKLEKMGIVSKLNAKTVAKIRDNPYEDSHLYALFYLHVLRVDYFEDAMKHLLQKNLEKYMINNKYDLDEMFSVKNKVKKKNNSNSFITDIRAVRNCLAHFLYEIIIIENDWFIHLKAGQFEKDSMCYDVIFSKKVFLNFLNDSNILYQCQHMLLSILSAITYLKPLSKEKLRVHKISYK